MADFNRIETRIGYDEIEDAGSIGLCRRLVELKKESLKKEAIDAGAPEDVTVIMDRNFDTQDIVIRAIWR